MKLSAHQNKAVDAVKQWMDHGQQPFFYLAGSAGTGKTVLANHLAKQENDTVLFAAFTGKAASVLRSKGCPGATTIHSLIYTSRGKSELKVKQLEKELLGLVTTGTEKEKNELRRLIKVEKDNLLKPHFTLNTDSVVKTASLLIIDECSMIDMKIGEDLLSFGTKILVLGDPGQLPPVYGAGFFTSHQPDFLLTEIHRQAEGNPIIAMATQVRNKNKLAIGDYGDSKVINVSDLTPELILDADQLLVGRNATRTQSNNRVRQLLERDLSKPEVGDRTVCLRNDHDLGLMNGALWNIDKIGHQDEDEIYMNISPELKDSLPITVQSHMHHFQGRGDQLEWWEKKEAQEFDYGYALTVHKSQGSQWDHVVVFDESSCFRGARWLWLYTAITRAAKTVTVVEL